jgi:putative transcriptional regulator
MPIVRYTAEQLRRKKGFVDRKKLAATTEADIARYAAEDDSSTDHIDFKKELREGRLRIVLPVNVAAVRRKTKMSQERFARAFRISTHTLRNWEQGRRVPDGPALALLTAINRDPKTMMRLLQD